MKHLSFKTNLKCQGCVDKIAQTLNENPSIKNWKVDLLSPEKILEVETSLESDEIQQIIEKKGYKVTKI